LHALQSTPSTPSEQFVAPTCGDEQVPTVLPVAMVQMPPQQSLGFEQASPF
jgi:hypothetical protein